MKSNNLVIAIGRQFGSGGSVLGKALANRLGISYYDKEILAEVAGREGLNIEFFEKSDERLPSMSHGLFGFAMGYNSWNIYTGPLALSDENLYRAQSDFIHDTAAKESCVFVGRTADYVLRDNPNCISVFVHAPLEDCAKRVMKRDGLTYREAVSKVQKINKLRADYYNFYTDKIWGDASSYDLCFDTSKVSMETLVDVIATYVKQRI